MRVGFAVGFALLRCRVSSILRPSSIMLFVIETQDLTADGAKQTASAERVADATAPRFGLRVFTSAAAESPEFQHA
jgi:hypothetical protein